MVKIVVVGASPEGEDFSQAPGEVVSAVRINGLEEAEQNPQVHGHEVKISHDGNPNDGNTNNAKAQDHSLDRRGVLGSKTEGSAVSVVELVDVLVQRAVVQATMHPVMPGILNDEEDADLKSYGPNAGERNTVVEAEVGGDRMEQPDLREFDGAVAEEDEHSAVPLFLPGGQFRLYPC